MAGAVSELMRWAMENAFKQLDPNKTRIVMVDPGDRVLRAMPEMLSKAALKSLQSDGVEFLPKGRVQTMRPGEVMAAPNCGAATVNIATRICARNSPTAQAGSIARSRFTPSRPCPATAV